MHSHTGVDRGEVALACIGDEILAAADEKQDVVEHGGKGIAHGGEGSFGGGVVGSRVIGSGGVDVIHEGVTDDGRVKRGADRTESIELINGCSGEANSRVERRGRALCSYYWDDPDEFVSDVDADGEHGWCGADFTLRAIEDGVVGPGGDLR